MHGAHMHRMLSHVCSPHGTHKMQVIWKQHFFHESLLSKCVFSTGDTEDRYRHVMYKSSNFIPFQSGPYSWQVWEMLL